MNKIQLYTYATIQNPVSIYGELKIKTKNGNRLSQDVGLTRKIWDEKTNPDEPVLGLVLLGSFEIIINETKSSRFATSKMGAELENKDAVGVLNLIETSQFLLQLHLPN
jgi:hypothetical protein